jgi:hypothetical protein
VRGGSTCTQPSRKLCRSAYQGSWYDSSQQVVQCRYTKNHHNNKVYCKINNIPSCTVLLRSWSEESYTYVFYSHRSIEVITSTSDTTKLLTPVSISWWPTSQ